MTSVAELEEVIQQPFGTQFAPTMMVATFKDGAWSSFAKQDYGPLTLMPSAHVLHYASTIFEGLKAHKHGDGSINIFRLDQHVARFQQSAGLLHLPIPDYDATRAAIIEGVQANATWTPDTPGSLYIRPSLIGTMPHIGAAAAPTQEAMLMVMYSPVGDYFKAGPNPLKILIQDEALRTAPHFGYAKTGGNYASALGQILKAKEEHGVNQVLFCPDGDVQETGAANFVLINDNEIMTKNLDSSFLHGVTRRSILELGAAMGYKVTERSFTVEEMLAWTREGECALSGTAAVLAGIGSFVYKGETIPVGNGQIGPNTQKLREALVNIHSGQTSDKFGWLTKVC